MDNENNGFEIQGSTSQETLILDFDLDELIDECLKIPIKYSTMEKKGVIKAIRSIGSAKDNICKSNSYITKSYRSKVNVKNNAIKEKYNE